MPLNNLPASLVDIIQTGLLERRFMEPLRAKLGFRAIADREPFQANIGETLTKTRAGLLPAITTPLAPASNTDLTSGLTPQVWPTEQYTISIAQYAGNAMTNIVTSRVAIASVFLQNVIALAEQAARSIDTIAQQALFGAYLGGNTRVLTTLGAPATTIHVDDIRGFTTVFNTAGQQVAVSGSNTLNVTVGSNVYALSGATADGTNTSTAPSGISGTLTFTTNVSVADGTAGNAVISAVAPSVIRPSATSNNVMANTTAAINAGTMNNAGRVTAQMILTAKAQLSANNVPPGPNGNYIGYFDPVQLTGLYQDPAFQYFFRGEAQTPEWRRGRVTELLGVDIVETNLNPVENLTGVGLVRRGIICGRGALIEAEFTQTAYQEAQNVDDGNLVTVVDGIAHVTREPLDALKQVVTQTWAYLGGFATPTDTTANPTTLPSASNSAWKRAIMIESL
jgi:hypothetical protein